MERTISAVELLKEQRYLLVSNQKLLVAVYTPFSISGKRRGIVCGVYNIFDLVHIFIELIM
jgi:hypothetical protein